MPVTYSVTLTDEQEFGLQYEVEQENMRRASMVPPGGVAQPPTTAEQMLTERVSMVLFMSYNQVKQGLEVVNAMIAANPAVPLETLLAGVPSPAMQAYLRAKHQA